MKIFKHKQKLVINWTDSNPEIVTYLKYDFENKYHVFLVENKYERNLKEKHEYALHEVTPLYLLLFE